MPRVLIERRDGGFLSEDQKPGVYLANGAILPLSIIREGTSNLVTTKWWLGVTKGYTCPCVGAGCSSSGSWNT